MDFFRETCYGFLVSVSVYDAEAGFLLTLKKYFTWSHSFPTDFWRFFLIYCAHTKAGYLKWFKSI